MRREEERMTTDHIRQSIQTDRSVTEGQAIPTREIRAVYDEDTIRVYQAYSDPIANAALQAGRFVEPFKLSRMTWIKPSFLWMMYRCGWGRKDSGQHRVLAIDISRDGFAWALEHSCSSHPKGMTKAEARALMDRTPVRVQWDPERDLHHRALDHRSIQVGLSGEAVNRYVNDWILNITEITDMAHDIHDMVIAGRDDEAANMLPLERPYPNPVPGVGE